MIQQEGASEGQGMGARQGQRSVGPQGKLQEKMVLAPGWRQVCSTESHAKNQPGCVEVPRADVTLPWV